MKMKGTKKVSAIQMCSHAGIRPYSHAAMLAYGHTVMTADSITHVSIPQLLSEFFSLACPASLQCHVSDP